MKYETPNVRWKSIYGIGDFKTFTNRLVVKGLFHECVPTDVKEAYESTEHIMAYAYYHYPLYDEATSKILRIIEMAVKLRCKEIGIELTQVKNAKKRNLKALMDELALKEPAKELLEIELDNVRRLRNIFMHPERHSFSGVSAYGFIKRSIILLNKIFIANTLFDFFNNELNRVQKLLTFFSNCVLVLEYLDTRYLVENPQVKGAIEV